MPKDIKKLLLKADKLQMGKELALAEEFIDIGEKMDENKDIIEKKLDTTIQGLNDLKEIKNVIENKDTEVIRTELLHVVTLKGDKGDDYILTNKDKKEIASMVKVPVVEKVVEKVTEVVNQPIESIIEKAVYESGIDIVNKINLLPIDEESQIDASHIKNLPETVRSVGFGSMIKEAPKDDKFYARKNRQWEEITNGGDSTWGSITGTLSNQTDLQNALNLKYDASNPAGYITSSALSGYLQNNVGIAGGTTLIGGTASGNNLTLVSTSNATKGKILFGNYSAYDEANNRLGIGTTTPANLLSILGNSGAPGGVSFDVKNSNASGDTRFTLSNSSNKSLAVSVTGSSYGANTNAAYLFTQGGLSNMTFMTDGDVESGGSGYISFATGGYILAAQERMRITSTGNIGIGTTTPHTSAILDLVSITKGLSIPTMNSTQASAIASPKKSLMIYVTDINGTFTSAGWWGYNGTVWKLILAE